MQWANRALPSPKEGSDMEMIVLWTTVIALGAAAGLVLTKMIRLDGYGLRPAPRGTDDWDAQGLPSHPYGI